MCLNNRDSEGTKQGLIVQSSLLETHEGSKQERDWGNEEPQELRIWDCWRDAEWSLSCWGLKIRLYTQPDGIWIDNDTRKMSWFDSRWRLGIERWVLFLCRWARCCHEVVTVGIFRTTKVSQRSCCVMQGPHQTSPCSSSSCHFHRVCAEFRKGDCFGYFTWILYHPFR